MTTAAKMDFFPWMVIKTDTWIQTLMYGERFLWTWYKMLVPTYQNVQPMLNINTTEELEFSLDCNVSI